MLHSVNSREYKPNAILEFYWEKKSHTVKTITVNEVTDIKTALNDTAVNCLVKTGNEIFEVEQMSRLMTKTKWHPSSLISLRSALNG